MRLRNKKTGEINLGDLHLDDFNSLAELNEEWEDYHEEPKEYWCIREDAVVDKRPYPIVVECVEQDNRDAMREIGNYFETKEEAEKAVLKLKVIKSLKDKGFKFTGWYLPKDGPARIIIEGTPTPDTVEELDILFGGEE